MRNIIIIILLILFLVPITVYSSAISIEKAKSVAVNWYQEMYYNYSALKNLSKSTKYVFEIDESFVEQEDSDTIFYIFNFKENGFVIVSAEDITIPILGYSFTGRYNPNNLPLSFTDFLNSYKKQIIHAKKKQTNSK